MYRSILKRSAFQSKRTLTLSHNCIRYQIRWEEDIKKPRVQKIKKYWFDKYVNYIKNYEEVLQKNFPKTMHVYSIFSVGVKEFIKEMKQYVLILKKQNLEGIESLTAAELRISHTMPKDLIRICPVLLISVVPFTNYIIFPLAYYFPRQLLTSHFWTLQQKLDFMLLDHKKRLKHNRPLFRCMQAELHNINDEMLKEKWNSVVACLGSGTHPQVKDILACSELFRGQPFSLNSLKRRHLNQLLGIHGMSAWRPFKRKKLTERGLLIKRLDHALQKEGGTMTMSNDAMRWALSFRGVNPANMSLENMRNWLDQWFVISNNTDEDTISLLLHSPILLAYNHSTNWILLYSS